MHIICCKMQQCVMLMDMHMEMPLQYKQMDRQH